MVSSTSLRILHKGIKCKPERKMEIAGQFCKLPGFEETYSFDENLKNEKWLLHYNHILYAQFKLFLSFSLYDI